MRIVFSFGLVLALLTWPARVQAQFTCTTNNGAVTITGYTGPNDVVVIPGTVEGYPVTSIGDHAFYNFSSLTSVTLPNSVTNIGCGAFAYCFSLVAVMVDANNPSYSSVGGPCLISCGGR